MGNACTISTALAIHQLNTRTTQPCVVSPTRTVVNLPFSMVNDDKAKRKFIRGQAPQSIVFSDSDKK